jgi:ribose transport system ATP-binding protein
MVSGLAASERTGVAIARALREDPEYPAGLLVLDEPTATLPVDEVDHLLDRVAAIAATGVGVLYVTHHLGEVFRVAQKVSVFRDGKVVGAGPVAEFDHASIVHLLAGEELLNEESETRRQKAGRAAARKHDTVFEISDLHAGAAAGISLTAERGEIVGIAGLAGSGRDNVLGAAFGSLPRKSGEVKVAGKPLPSSRPDVAIGQGVAYVAPDRKTGGCVMTMSARENLTLPDLKPFWKGGGVRRKADLHRELVTVAEEGAAVLISSSDLEELADLCDRVLVIVDGKISSVLEGAQLTQSAITRSFMPLAAEPVDAS